MTQICPLEISVQIIFSFPEGLGRWIYSIFLAELRSKVSSISTRFHVHKDGLIKLLVSVFFYLQNSVSKMSFSSCKCLSWVVQEFVSKSCPMWFVARFSLEQGMKNSYKDLLLNRRSTTTQAKHKYFTQKVTARLTLDCCSS